MLLELLNNYKSEFIFFAWLSFALFVVSVAIIPWLIIKIPEDYFQERHRFKISKNIGNTYIAQMLAGFKNLIGLLLIILGILMLILPGQGILTILMGLFLMNFPGKYRLERKIASHPRVLKSLNWIRSKAHKAPLVVE